MEAMPVIFRTCTLAPVNEARGARTCRARVPLWIFRTRVIDARCGGTPAELRLLMALQPPTRLLMCRSSSCVSAQCVDQCVAIVRYRTSLKIILFF